MSKDDEADQLFDASYSTDLSDESQTQNYKEEAREFYDRLEQTGRLMDVDYNTDLGSLPPNITHVRYPDGTVKRVGFSSSV